MSQLDMENLVVLDLVQAMLGLISPEIRGVSVDASQRIVTVHFAVADLTNSVREDIDEIIVDAMSNLWNHFDDFAPEIFVGEPDQHWSGFNFRKIYIAKPRD